MECNFCNKKEIGKEVLFQTKNFFVVPALGSFLPYYFLIVSKEHQNSLAKVLINQQISKEFDQIKNKVIKFIKFKTKHNSEICFEHAANSEDIVGSGCCISHCHIHILPYQQPVINSIKKKIGQYQAVKDYTQLNKLVGQDIDSYLLVEQDDKIKIWKNKNIISQFMRRLIADNCNLGNRYDWKKFPYREEMETTTKEWNNWLKK
ncbi:MAG: hypothetical protein ACD_72C00531G0002 [uncultured bacterium]|nr:MAG: hypothetical protein ACD_72C00531G0002 [uncultured bacterium]